MEQIHKKQIHIHGPAMSSLGLVDVMISYNFIRVVQDGTRWPPTPTSCKWSYGAPTNPYING